MKPNATEETVLEGVLVPIGWELSGEVSNVGLMTFDENEYRIASATARDHSLKNHLRRHVRLCAIVRDRRVIRVRRTEVLGIEGRGSPPHEGNSDEHVKSGCS